MDEIDERGGQLIRRVVFPLCMFGGERFLARRAEATRLRNARFCRNDRALPAAESASRLADIRKHTFVRCA